MTDITDLIVLTQCNKGTTSVFAYTAIFHAAVHIPWGVIKY